MYVYLIFYFTPACKKEYIIYRNDNEASSEYITLVSISSHLFKIILIFISLKKLDRMRQGGHINFSYLSTSFNFFFKNLFFIFKITLK